MSVYDDRRDWGREHLREKSKTIIEGTYGEYELFARDQDREHYRFDVTKAVWDHLKVPPCRRDRIQVGISICGLEMKMAQDTNEYMRGMLRRIDHHVGDAIEKGRLTIEQFEQEYGFQVSEWGFARKVTYTVGDKWENDATFSRAEVDVLAERLNATLTGRAGYERTAQAIQEENERKTKAYEAARQRKLNREFNAAVEVEVERLQIESNPLFASF